MNPDYQIIGEARDCDQLVELYRDRKRALGLTDKWFDQYSGLASGHIGKLFGDARVKNLGPASIYAINCSLAVKFLVVVDEEQVATMQGKWEERERPVAMRATASKRAIERFTPIVIREHMKKIQPLGGKARAARMTKEQRSRAARKAARARWKTPRVTEIKPKRNATPERA